MIATTYLTSRQMILKTGWAEDPQQRMLQRLMLYGIPASLLISGAIFPIGVIIYWVTNNLFTLAQQQWVLRKFPPPPMTGRTGSGSRTSSSGSGSGSRTSSGSSSNRNPVQPAKSGGIFSRRSDAAKANGAKANGGQPEAKPVDGKALAPKPGAKPVRPNKGRRPPAKRKS
jgi:YidC/Oxa1 family membrane protein insertase